MTADAYRPERDITPTYLATVYDWISSTKEVLVIMRYLRGGGSKDFALISSPDSFDRLIEVLPLGADIIVLREPQLPIRGIVDSKFVELVQASLAGVEEYLLVNLVPVKADDPRCSGAFDYVVNLQDDLQEMMGENIAAGPCPSFTGHDNDAMISASKGGIDGAR